MNRALFTLGVFIWYFWRFEPFRYLGNHGWIGLINFAIVGLLLLVGFGHYVATTVGHVAHVLIAFFVDRDSTYRALDVTVGKGMIIYWLVEGVSFGSIFLMLFLLSDMLGWDSFLVRVVIAAPLATAISYYGNRFVTFK